MNFFAEFAFQAEAADFAAAFQRNKVVHVKPGQAVADLDLYYKQLADQCGVRLVYDEDPVSGQILADQWTEIKYNPEKATDAYKYSNKHQPLHTDYGYFSFEIYASFFYCVEQAPFGGATTFIDVDTVVSILRDLAPSLLEHVKRQKIRFGRNDNPIANNEDFILREDETGWRINWNYYRALGDTANMGLIEDFRDFLDTYIEKSGELKEVKLRAGEGVFFHDKRVLHGRNSFIGHRQLNKGAIATTLPDPVAQLLAKL